MTPIVIAGPTVSTGFSVVIDPDDTPLDISDGSSYRLRDQIGLPDWPLKSVYAGSFDTYGSLPASRHMYDNGELTIPLRIYGTSAANLLTQVGKVRKKVAKLNRAESHGIGGEVKITFPSGNSYRFDVVEARAVHNLTQSFVTRFRVDDELRLVVLPGVRGEEQSLGSFSEATLPWLTAVVSGIKGELEAQPRVLLTDAQGVDQWAVFVGAESEHYSAAATAALGFEAESRTPLGGAATAVGASGASGGGSNVVRQGTLIPGWQAMLSTQAAGGGAHLTHEGLFQVLVRIYRPTTNTGEVSLRFDHAVGDGRWTQGREITFDADAFEGLWTLVALETVTIRAASQGTHSWEGRIVAKSTVAGDDLDVDWIAFCPMEQHFSIVQPSVPFDTPTAFSARDEFDQSAGALTGKTLPAGGTWQAVGDTDDFAVETTGKTAERTATNDTVPGRIVTATTPTLTATLVQVDGKMSSRNGSVGWGVIARYTDVDDWIKAELLATVSATPQFRVINSVAGATTVNNFISFPAFSVGGYYSIRLVVDAGGRYWAWLWTTGSMPGAPLLSGQHADLATGGAQASGKVGFSDFHFSASGAVTRNYDNFLAAVPVTDAAMFASQSLELRHNVAERENAAGTKWAPIVVEGSHARLAVSGMEGRSNRLFAKAVRGFEVQDSVWLDPSIDDLALAAFATPIYTSVPEP